jgi:hypothetical protein
MPSNEERREAAAKFREMAEKDDGHNLLDDSTIVTNVIVGISRVNEDGTVTCPASVRGVMRTLAGLIEPEPVLSEDIVSAIKDEIGEDNVYIHLIDDEHVLVIDKEVGKKADVYVAPRYERTCHVAVGPGTDEFDLCCSCSECNFGWHISKHDIPFRFCPYCGAKVIADD